MIHADLDKILPEEDALEQITTIFNEVEKLRELYIITKNGRPAVAVINIDYLEELTGQEVKQSTADDVSKEPTSQLKVDEVEPLSTSEPAVTSESDLSTAPTVPLVADSVVSDEIEVDEGPLITEEEANKIPAPPTSARQVEPQTPPLAPLTPQTASAPQSETANHGEASLNLPPEPIAGSPTPPAPTVPPLADNNLNSSTDNPANSSPLI